MTKYNIEGFLSDEIDTWIEKYHSENKELFDHCYKLNTLAHLTVEKISVHDNNLQELMVSALFVRMLSQYQSVIILIERGLVNESKILMRAMLDILFILVAISKDEKYAKYYVNDDIEKRIEFLKRFKKTSGIILKVS